MYDVNRFLSDLLDKGPLSGANRKRFLTLVDGELKKRIVIAPEVLNRIKILREMDVAEANNKRQERTTALQKAPEHVVKNSEAIESGKLPNHINPRNVVQFLTILNKTPILKATTHSIDADLLNELLIEMEVENYDYEIHLKYIKEKYDALLKQFSKALPSAIVAKLNEFYFLEKKTGWSEANIQISWYSPEIGDWCKENPGKCPNPGSDLNYPSPDLQRRERVQDGYILNTFQDVINLLKMQIECRDHSYLENTIERLNHEKFPNLKINLDNVVRCLSFYTDVEKVKQAYVNIINLCKEVHNRVHGSIEKLEIEVGLKHETRNGVNVVVLSILDKGGKFLKNIEPSTFRYGNTLTRLIKNQLNGLCNIELKTVVPDGSSVFFSLWPKGKRTIPLKDAVNGVLYNLIFYVE